jgi:hypothetical protein
MFGELFKKIGGALGLTKRSSPIGGLLNKAKGWVSSGLDFLRGKPVKNVIDKVSEYIPSVRSYYDDARKYGAIVGNALSGNALGKKADRALDRFIKKDQAIPSIERVPRAVAPAPGMFDQPQANPSLF